MAKAIIGPVRFSYLNVYEPVDRNNTGNKKYSATLLIPKTDKQSIAKINEAIKQAEKEGLNKKFNGKAPAKIANPVHDGDGNKENGEPYGPECKGCYIMTASANEMYPPELISGQDRHHAYPDEFYSGCYGYASINFAAYNYNGKKGIGAYLNSLFKTKDGEPLAQGKASAKSDFANLNDIEFDLEEPTEYEALI